MRQGIRTINKITAPDSSNVHPRTRLFQRLDTALEKPVLWIESPAGSGKSSLVASYLESRNLPCIWYQVDEGDADYATLFHYMRLAANILVGDDQAPLPLLTKEYQQQVKVFTRRYFEALFSRLPSAAVIVFDDYHEVGKESLFHEVIQNALAAIPPGIRAIVISREGPPPTLARLVSQRRIGIMSWEDLRLTPEELEGVIEANNYGPLNGKDSEALLEKTGGWVAGVIFMMERGATDETSLMISPQETLLDYFDCEVFAQNDASIQDFLLKTAFMKQFSPEMACQLTGIAAAAAILTELNSRNFFTEKFSGSSPTYSYHPLFRAFLINRAHVVFPRKIIDETKQLAAKILEENGFIELAAELYLAAMDWADFSRLVQRVAEKMITRGRSITLDSWISEMPRDVLDESPWLLYWLGVCRFTGQVLEARSLYERALQLFRATEDVEGIYQACSGILNSYQHALEDWRELKDWVALLDELILTYPLRCTPQNELRFSISMYTALVMLQTDHQSIKEWRKRLEALLDNNQNSFLHLKAVYAMAIHDLWSGDYMRMHLLLKSVEHLMSRPDTPPLGIIMLKTMEAFYYWQTAQVDLCRRAAGEGLAIANKSGIESFNSRMIICRLKAELIDGEAVPPKNHFEKLDLFKLTGNNLNLSNYYFGSVMHALLMNDLPRAVSCIDLAETAVMKIGSLFHECLWCVGKAQVLTLQMNESGALQYISKALKLSLRICSHNMEYISRLTCASILFGINDRDNGLLMLRKAMAIGRQHQYEYAMWWNARMIVPLCVTALEAGIEVEYVQWLARRRRLTTEEIPLSCDIWPWPVKVNALGDFSILVDGIPLKATGKVQKKPIEMLKALIALGGMEKSAGQITDLLWPEADGDTAKNSFKVTLHRLRQLLGHEEAIQMSSGRLSMDKRFFCTDVWVYEELLNAAQMQGESGNEAEAVRLTEKALSTYRGNLLDADNDKPWLQPLRVRLKNKFVLNIIALGNLFQKKGNMERALDCYMRGLELSPHDEEIFLNLMKFYLTGGLHNEAVKAYRSFRLALAEIGFTPSNRIVTLYKTVLQA